MTSDRLTVVVTRRAQRDIKDLLEWSAEKFGDAASLRYEDLISQALLDLATDPLRHGAKVLQEIRRGREIYVYHLASSRDRMSGKAVKKPRHFIMYQVNPPTLEIVRVLQDQRNLTKHIPPSR